MLSLPLAFLRLLFPVLLGQLPSRLSFCKSLWTALPLLASSTNVTCEDMWRITAFQVFTARLNAVHITFWHLQAAFAHHRRHWHILIGSQKWSVYLGFDKIAWFGQYSYYIFIDIGILMINQYSPVVFKHGDWTSEYDQNISNPVSTNDITYYHMAIVISRNWLLIIVILMGTLW